MNDHNSRGFDPDDEDTEAAGRDEYDNLVNEPHFEKFQRRDRAGLPVSSHRKADRSAKKTQASRRVRKNISQNGGGIHRRRQKSVR